MIASTTYDLVNMINCISCIRLNLLAIKFLLYQIQILQHDFHGLLDVLEVQVHLLVQFRSIGIQFQEQGLADIVNLFINLLDICLVHLYLVMVFPLPRLLLHFFLRLQSRVQLVQGLFQQAVVQRPIILFGAPIIKYEFLFIIIPLKLNHQGGGVLIRRLIPDLRLSRWTCFQGPGAVCSSRWCFFLCKITNNSLLNDFFLLAVTMSDSLSII